MAGTVTTTPPNPPSETLADLLHRLGGVSPERVRLHPSPGTATVDDVIAIAERERRLYELVEGTLVEKAMGIRESLLAGALIGFLRACVAPQNLGLVSGESGTMRLFGSLVRIPDVAFVSWKRIPGGRVPEEPVPLLAPDVAVEVLSRGNTRAEMERKCREYFQAGVLLVWIVDPRARTVAVFTAPDEFTVLHETDILDAGDVIPGFRLPLGDLFAELDRTASGFTTH